jgi:HEAT repeat protein
VLDTSGPDIAAMIGAQDDVTRVAAVRVLGRVFEERPGDPPLETTVGDAIVGALNDRQPDVRAAALDALGAIRYERAVGALTDLFRYYRNGVVAEAALDAIARIAHGSSGNLLVEQLSSKTADVRGIAFEGLARLGDRGRLAAVQPALAAERNGVVRLAGSFAVAALSDAPLTPLVEALDDPKLRDQAFRYLVDLAQRSPEGFGPLMQSRGKDVRIRADLVNALALGRNPSALPLVEPLTKDSDPQVARAATRAVAWLR